MNNIITTPVLLIGFNRPDEIKVTLDAIRQVRPSKLYVAIDGARSNKTGEEAKVAKVKRIVENIDWPCETHYRYAESNLGCKGNIPSAISWVLENEDRVIIIEDDIVAPPSFFLFEEQMLERYKDDSRIAMVSGNNYTPINIDTDYLFSNYACHIWGWGTWKRSWKDFDVNIPSLMGQLQEGLPKLKSITNSRAEYRFYLDYYKRIRKSQLGGYDNYWGPQYMYFILENNLLVIVPRVNLASNIGNISSRDNRNNSKIGQYYYKADDTFYVVNYPTIIERNIAYDKYHFKMHINNVPLIVRLRRLYHRYFG